MSTEPSPAAGDPLDLQAGLDRSCAREVIHVALRNMGQDVRLDRGRALRHPGREFAASRHLRAALLAHLRASDQIGVQGGYGRAGFEEPRRRGWAGTYFRLSCGRADHARRPLQADAPSGLAWLPWPDKCRPYIRLSHDGTSDEHLRFACHRRDTRKKWNL